MDDLPQAAEHARIAERARKLLAEAKRATNIHAAILPYRDAATLALLAYETLAGQVIQAENDV